MVCLLVLGAQRACADTYAAGWDISWTVEIGGVRVGLVEGKRGEVTPEGMIKSNSVRTETLLVAGNHFLRVPLPKYLTAALIVLVLAAVMALIIPRCLRKSRTRRTA
jgi:hypothetical protein